MALYPIRCRLVAYKVDAVWHCGHLIVDKGDSLIFSLDCCMCTVCHGLLVLPLGVLGKLYS